MPASSVIEHLDYLDDELPELREILAADDGKFPDELVIVILEHPGVHDAIQDSLEAREQIRYVASPVVRCPENASHPDLPERQPVLRFRSPARLGAELLGDLTAGSVMDPVIRVKEGEPGR